MSTSVRRSKGLPFFPTIAKSFATWRRALPLSSCVPSSRQRGLSQRRRKVQKPVYYASWALHGAEERYPPMEKLAFTLVTTARKLKPYFQAHKVIILTDKPLQRAMSNPKAVSRLTLWAIELSEFDIQYRPHRNQGTSRRWLHSKVH